MSFFHFNSLPAVGSAHTKPVSVLLVLIGTSQQFSLGRHRGVPCRRLLLCDQGQSLVDKGC